MARAVWLTEPRALAEHADAVWSRIRRRLQAGPIRSWRFAGPVPERILFSPACILPADPISARDIYQGQFTFGGRTVQSGGESPFSIEAPSAAWLDELHGFSWLRHLKQAESDLASANARALISDWIRLCGRDLKSAAWAPHATAKRLIAWLQHARFILTESDHAFYRAFMSTIGRMVRYLRAISVVMPEDEELLTVRIALCYASLTLPQSAGFQRRAANRLDTQLKKQILPDGGHGSRNGDVLVRLLCDLLPLSQAYATASVALPQELRRTIDRIFPAVRAMRHSDGQMGNFNGAGTLDAGMLAAVLRHDGTGGEPISLATHSGYRRLTGGQTVVLADAAAPPPKPYRTTAHAGVTAFEMSSGRQRFIVNAGVDRLKRNDYEAMVRATASHCCPTVDDTSSARFLRVIAGPPERRYRMFAGAQILDQADWNDDSWTGFRIGHNGYASRFGLILERGIRLNAEGTAIDGYDRIRPARKANASRHTVDLRFHLHPSVAASPALDGPDGAILLQSSAHTQPSWIFHAEDHACELEESVYFAGTAGPVRTSQIVVSIRYPEVDAVTWHMRQA